jgi:hypothetical protein
VHWEQQHGESSAPRDGSSVLCSADNGQTGARGCSQRRCHTKPLAIIGEGGMTRASGETRKGSDHGFCGGYVRSVRWRRVIQRGRGGCSRAGMPLSGAAIPSPSF